MVNYKYNQNPDWGNIFLNHCPLDNFQFSQTPQLESQNLLFPWLFLSFLFILLASFQDPSCISSILSFVSEPMFMCSPTGQWWGLSSERSPQEKPTSVLLMVITSHIEPNVLFWKRSLLPRDEMRKDEGLKSAPIAESQESIEAPLRSETRNLKKWQFVCFCEFSSKKLQHLGC